MTSNRRTDANHTTMTNAEKSDLQWKVRWYIGDQRTDEYIIEKLTALGFKKATIKTYIKAFRKD